MTAAPTRHRATVDARTDPSRTAGVVDFDLHGIVGVRLTGATPSDVAAVRRQLGPIERPLSREPDIEIRFVDRMRPASTVRLLDLDDAAFDDESYFILQSRYQTRARAQIPFDQIGSACELVCESGLPAVPLLIPIVNLTALAKGVLALHASAFVYQGTGALVTGWSKGGKTEALLAFMDNGAEYIGDEWVYLTPDGNQIFGVPEPIKIWEWHLDDLPRYRERIGWRGRARMAGVRLAEKVETAVPNRATSAGRATVRGRVMSVVARQRFVRMHPAELFGESACRLAGKVDRVFLLVSHEADDVTAEPVGSAEIAQRMVFSLQHERLDFLFHYLKFLFAFPERRNELIEQAEELERELLVRALADKPAYVVSHGFPAPIPALFERMAPLLA